ncbi:DegT/DnrJ/EryC1/StrS family aminotransferase [Legionella oakridgensis]|uniref:Cell wall biosynthesis regulatory pyridoxal phosphate-dependent protein n=2 Tax=Legionella oakridgensis TaxID=29423 RepID=A0A0W0X130_9GAMM|nr:DegT/DnrJ/EryC1/StrS family aminotransferase [Legionella oakridgensis]AHE65632.1 putative pyridoxal phosphate-dependent enzyme [Legionella oakridgensis ATCC 33761 = DSM 21215]KTD38279.1 cell wall biosynthesis regulatory pyridoxal phosphate-dependent protein [Legionella oakridgensis]STY15589.1 pyridoxal phosphate-dependent enzyme [Legionella longbeachae]
MQKDKPFIKVAAPQINDQDINAAITALKSEHLTSGPIVTEFEKQFAHYCGTEYAVAVSNGTAAIHAALAAAGIGPGDEVIVPALTFFSTATAVIHQGAVPIFADISVDNYCLDPEDVIKRITPRTKAIIPVHYFGHAAEMDALMEIAHQHNLFVIEDCAQAHGTEYKHKKVGSIGHFGAFSMFATKHMTTAGEGGMILTNNTQHAEYMKKFRSHGLEGRNDHVILGYNYRLPEFAGAVGLTQLARLDEMNAARIKVCEQLIAAIKDIEWLTVPNIPKHVKHTYFWCHIGIDEEKLGMRTKALIQKLQEEEIEVRHRYEVPLYKQPLLNQNLPAILKLSAGENLMDYGRQYLPNVEKLAGKVIGLPNRPDLTHEEISRIAYVLRSIK